MTNNGKGCIKKEKKHDHACKGRGGGGGLKLKCMHTYI